MEPFEGEEAQTKDLAFVPNGPNEHGPNLRGVATKVNETWLFNWIKNPKAYWADTRMPDLRLSDQDAADVARYMIEDPDGIFTDVPDDWETGQSSIDTAALREQARWFYQKLGRGEVERRLNGENPDVRWDDEQTLAVAVGEKLVMHHGCFSCHEISGMEEMMPIGTELSNWGSKTVDKLDFAFSYLMALGEDLPKLEHEYREGWIERKLHRPRSYDKKKIKNPREKLRMPQFDFTDEEVKSIATFVVGLVDDEVQLAKMEPTPEELAMDTGLRVMRQKNCQACHVIEPGRVRFFDEDGYEHEVPAELLPLEGETLPPTMASLDAFETYLEGYEDYMEEEVEELSFRLLGSAPGVGAPGDKVFVERENLIDVKPAWGGNFVKTVVEYYLYGIEQFDEEAEDEEDAYYYVTADPDDEGRIEDVDGEFRAYYEEPYDKVRWTFAPPVLIDEGTKLQPEWFFSFLYDPVPLRRQMRVRMPTFHYDEGEAGAIADYFANKSKKNWPAVYTRNLRLALGQEPKETFVERYADVPQDERPLFLTQEAWPLSALFGEGEGLPVEDFATLCGLEPKTIAFIEEGSQADIDANFQRVLDFGESIGFEMRGPVDPGYERVERRSPTYLAARERQVPGDLHPATLGEAVAIQGPNCYQCHFHEGQAPDQVGTPIAWAPDLSLARERLREDWTRDWLWGPNLVYPGTSMPANFVADPPEYQALYPDSSNAEQIQAVLDWLYNFDRTPPMVSK
jgi:mono/diheme cytochrome c family protein